MSRVLYDFLNDSVLFDEGALESSFASIAEPDLRRELVNYRAHVVARHEEIVDEVSGPAEGPRAYVGAAGSVRIFL